METSKQTLIDYSSTPQERLQKVLKETGTTPELTRQTNNELAEYDKQNKKSVFKKLGHFASKSIAKGIVTSNDLSLSTRMVKAKIGEEVNSFVADQAESTHSNVSEQLEKNQEIDASSRMQRMGNVALRGTILISEKIAHRSRSRVEHHNSKGSRLYKKYTGQAGTGIVVTAAKSHYKYRADEKSRVIAARKAAEEQVRRKYIAELNSFARSAANKADTNRAA